MVQTFGNNSQHRLPKTKLIDKFEMHISDLSSKATIKHSSTTLKLRDMTFQSIAKIEGWFPGSKQLDNNMHCRTPITNFSKFIMTCDAVMSYCKFHFIWKGPLEYKNLLLCYFLDELFY